MRGCSDYFKKTRSYIINSLLFLEFFKKAIFYSCLYFLTRNKLIDQKINQLDFIIFNRICMKKRSFKLDLHDFIVNIIFKIYN